MSASPASLRIVACVVVALAGYAPLAAAEEARPPVSGRIAVHGASAAAAEVTGSIAPAKEADSEASCTKVRRKMWVEGEGWIVRRVGVCR